MSTEQTAFFLHKTTSEKRRAKAFGAFAGSVDIKVYFQIPFILAGKFLRLSPISPF